MPANKVTKARGTAQHSGGQSALKRERAQRRKEEAESREREKNTVNMTRTAQENEIRLSSGPLPPRDDLAAIKHKSNAAKRGGSDPVYDDLGYEIDLDEIQREMTTPRDSSYENFKKLSDDADNDIRRRYQILFPGQEFDASSTGVMDQNKWDDKVALDLELPYHKVHFNFTWYEEWQRRGFKVGKDFFDGYSKEDLERISRISIGCAHRK